MKKIISSIALFIIIFSSKGQNVGIGTNTPNPSAALEVKDTARGFLPPRMSYAQRNAIINPALGLIVFCTDCGNNGGELQYYNNLTWVSLNSLTSGLPQVYCNQRWMSKNLDVTHYRNGDLIPKVTDPVQWRNLNSTGAWCWYNNDSATYASIYGRLYNWFAVNDPRGLAPSGWHVASKTEWINLITCLDQSADPNAINVISLLSGGKLKDTINFITPNIGATNSIGFSAEPAGGRGLEGNFWGINTSAYWWTSNAYSSGYPFAFYLFNYNSYISKAVDGAFFPSCGFSVRCVLD